MLKSNDNTNCFIIIIIIIHFDISFPFFLVTEGQPLTKSSCLVLTSVLLIKVFSLAPRVWKERSR